MFYVYCFIFKVAFSKNGNYQNQILKIYQFNSDFKRMSVISKWQYGKDTETRVLCKGAPEVIYNLLK